MVDEQGQPVSDAQLEVQPAVVPMPVHLDASGQRVQPRSTALGAWIKRWPMLLARARASA